MFVEYICEANQTECKPCELFVWSIAKENDEMSVLCLTLMFNIKWNKN